MNGADNKSGEINIVNFEDLSEPKEKPVYEFGPGPKPNLGESEQTQLARNIAEGLTDENGKLRTFELPDEGDVLEAVEKLAGKQPDLE